MNQKRQGKFINKLQYILNSKEYREIIRWDQSKTMIDILNLEQMENTLLPEFFRHRKYDSFVRQLNIYGFKKIKATVGIRFTHDHLLQGKELLEIVSNHPHKKQKRIEIQSELIPQNQRQVTKQEESDQKLKRNHKTQQNSIFQSNNFKNCQQNNQNNNINQVDMKRLLQFNQSMMIENSYFNYWNMLINNSNVYNGYYYVNPINIL